MELLLSDEDHGKYENTGKLILKNSSVQRKRNVKKVDDGTEETSYCHAPQHVIQDISMYVKFLENQYEESEEPIVSMNYW